MKDDFNAASIDTTKWQLSVELDRWSVVRVREGHLEVFGNGKWRGVLSTSFWRLPKEGQQGSLTVTFKIRPALLYLPSGHPLAIFDSQVGLLSDGKVFGFLLHYPEFSEGYYKVAAGGGWLQTKQPFTQRDDEYDFLLVTLQRGEEGSLCKLAYSKDGKQWVTLHSAAIALPKTVRIFVSSCWGAIAVDFVQLEVKGAVQEEISPIIEPQVDKTDVKLPFVYAHKVLKAQAPKIDGELSDTIWQSARKIELRHRIWVKKPITQRTIAQIAYDDTCLYIAFDCYEERMDLLRLQHKDPLSPVWQDDCVEVFIQPDPKNQPTYYFHAVVNALGVNWDEYGKYRQWQAATRQHPKGWAVEMVIPFSTIGAESPKRGEVWGINFCRSEHPHDETTSWAPVRGGFHDPERFGRLVFGWMSVRIDAIGIPEPTEEQKAQQIALLLASEEPTLKGTEIAIRISEGNWQKQVVKEIVERLTFSVPTDIPSGRYLCSVRLTAPKQPQLETVVPFYYHGIGNLNSALWPVEVYGNTLYVADGGLTMFYLLVSDRAGKQQGYEVILNVPEWADILEPPSRAHMINCPEIANIQRSIVTRDGQKYRQIIVQVKSPPPGGRIEEVELWNQSLRLWLKAEVPKGTSLPHRSWLYTQVRRADETEPVRRTMLVVLPPEVGRQPKHFPIYIWLHDCVIAPSGWEEMLRHYQRLGVNGLQEGFFDERFGDVAAKYGIGHMLSLWWFWWAPKYLSKHPEHAAINAEGKPADLRYGMVCPEVLLEESSEAFKEAFQSIVLNYKGKTVGWNWDLEGPGVWHVCFCARCLNAFRKFANLSAEQPLNFSIIRSDEKLRKQWLEFALWQTERMVAKWAKRIAEVRPDAGLYINSGGPGAEEANRLPWRKVLPYIKGGMFFRYHNSPIGSRTTFLQDSMRFLEAVRDIGTPIWAMLSVGYMRVGEVLNYHYPELTTLQMLQHALIGYRGIHFWSHRGFDGRFNNALARGARLIAEFEDWFLQGRQVTLPKDAVTAPDTVLVVAWEYTGKLAVFLLNFDPMRDAKVRIEASKLLNKRRRFVTAEIKKPVMLDKPIAVPKLGVIVLVSAK